MRAIVLAFVVAICLQLALGHNSWENCWRENCWRESHNSFDNRHDSKDHREDDWDDRRLEEDEMEGHHGADEIEFEQGSRHSSVRIEECARYCEFKEQHSMSSGLAVVLVLVCSLIFSSAAGLSARLLDRPMRPSLVAAAFVAGAALCIGLLLPASSRYPLMCAEVSWDTYYGLLLYPIAFLGAAGSYASLAVAVVFVTFHAGPLSRLAKLSVAYLFMVTACNTCGIVGVAYMSCHSRHLDGLPYYVGWIVSAFITNLVLQKIVVTRAAIIDAQKLPRCLQCIFCVEVVVALILFSGALFLAIVVSTYDFENEVEEEEKTSEEYERDDRSAQTTAQTMGLIVAFCSLLFVFFDLLFSVASSLAMISGIRKIQSQMAAGNVEQLAGPQSGMLRWPNVLARAMWFAKLNLVLVVLSVSTTTLFYLAFMSFSLLLVTPDLGHEVYTTRFALVFVSWLLDSLFNDVCVVFVGFGPTAAALATVGAAAKADIVGNPVSEFEMPAQLANETVVGHVVQPSELAPPQMASAEVEAATHKCTL